MSIDKYAELKRRLLETFDKSEVDTEIKAIIDEVDALEKPAPAVDEASQYTFKGKLVTEEYDSNYSQPATAVDERLVSVKDTCSLIDCRLRVPFKAIEPPRQPAPAVGEVCECGHGKDMHHSKNGMCNYCIPAIRVCRKFTPRQPAPEKCNHNWVSDGNFITQQKCGQCGAIRTKPEFSQPAPEKDKPIVLSGAEFKIIMTHVANLEQRLEKLEQAAGDITILRDRIDEIDRELEQAAGPLGEFLRKLVSGLYSFVFDEDSQISHDNIKTALAAYEKARQGT